MKSIRHKHVSTQHHNMCVIRRIRKKNSSNTEKQEEREKKSIEAFNNKSEKRKATLHSLTLSLSLALAFSLRS